MAVELAGLKPKRATTGLGQVYLAKLRTEVPHVDGEQRKAEPKYDDIASFRQKYEKQEDIQKRLRNKVKKCIGCGKPCAFTLKNCNSCGRTLEDVEISFNDNVFMGFIYGIAKGNFPYTISIRKQTEDVLCFDDPLRVTVVHLNSIPTSVYIPDLRYLFSNPPEGLRIVEKLYRTAADAALQHFWADQAFRTRFFAGETKTTPDDLLDIALCGMNYPPSMYQLHLQFIHPPLLPHHYAMAREENHFHHGRFFPLEYLKRALALGYRARMDIHEHSDVDAIIKNMNRLGVNYDEIHIAFMRRCRRIQERFSPWCESDFEFKVINNQAYSVDTLEHRKDVDVKAIMKEDEKAACSYGRPYKDGKESGSYYAFAKNPEDVTSFQPMTRSCVCECMAAFQARCFGRKQRIVPQ